MLCSKLQHISRTENTLFFTECFVQFPEKRNKVCLLLLIIVSHKDVCEILADPGGRAI
jgi:hypothetical protein